MQITDKKELIITIDGKTKLLTREEITNAFRDKTQYQKNMEAVQKFYIEKLKQANCANYERDNNLSEVEENIADYVTKKDWRKEYMEEQAEEFIQQAQKDKINVDKSFVFNSPYFPCSDPIVESVRQKLLDRSAVGIKKYGKTVDEEILKPSEWLEHAIQEGLDKVIYMTKLKKELEKEENEILELVASEQNDWELGKLIRKKYGK